LNREEELLALTAFSPKNLSTKMILVIKSLLLKKKDPREEKRKSEVIDLKEET